MFLVLIVCVGVITVVACTSQGKAKFQMHASMARTYHLQLADRHTQQLNSASQCRERRSRIKYLNEDDQPLKRSNSTIGFPTLEGKANGRTVASTSEYLHKKRKRGHCEKDHLGKTLRRTQSVPTLFPNTALTNLTRSRGAPSLSRRVNLNTVHTRIKRVGVEQSGLYSCSNQISREQGGKITLVEQGGRKTLVEQGGKKTLVEQGGRKTLVQGAKKTLVEQGGKKTLLKLGGEMTIRKEGCNMAGYGKMTGGDKLAEGNKVSGCSKVAEGSFRVIQDSGVTHKHYGVNEASSWRKGSSVTSSYAKYMVHSLATSARTPEPGSYPTTQL